MWYLGVMLEVHYKLFWHLPRPGLKGRGINICLELRLGFRIFNYLLGHQKKFEDNQTYLEI